MRLVTVEDRSDTKAAFLVGGVVVEAPAAAADVGLDPADWMSVRRILERPTDERSRVHEAAIQLASDKPAATRTAADVKFGPPVPNPDKVILLALNYFDHIEEGGFDVPEIPPIFAKFPNALVGPTADVRLPSQSEQVDWEGELAVVIGRTARAVDEAQAQDYIAGYMVLNDISARDLQFSTSQYTIGKACDDFAPCGPCLVTPDEIPDPHNLALTTWVNGQVVQQASTKEMIWSIPRSIAWLSELITLVPGDIISTGTPAGVGMNQKPPRYLRSGDVVEVEIEGIGRISNRMTGEVDRTTASHDVSLAT